MNQEIFNEIVGMFKKRNHILTVKGSDIPSSEDQIEMLKMLLILIIDRHTW